jgi:hypothetical protein
MELTINTKHLIPFLNQIIRATDHAEGRLMLIDAANNPSIAPNSDVIKTVKAANEAARGILAYVEMKDKD